MLWIRNTIIGLLLAGIPSYAQVLYGTAVGNVTSPDGKPVGSSKVIAKSPATGLSRETLTDDTGFWTLRSLEPGTYSVTVSATGFADAIGEVQVSASINSRLDVALKLSSTTQQVEVTATQSVLQTETGDRRAEITSGQIKNLPMSGYRNYQSLLDLIPGTTPSRFQNSVMDTPARSLTTNVNGTSRNSNMTSVDGAAIQQVYLPHHTLYNPPADAIESVNIATNSFTAEQGLAGGAVVTVLTKSGTNAFHGGLNHNHTNSALAARNFFFLGANTPLNLLNQFGATLGGPIRKNRLFFFSSYEGVIQRANFSRIISVGTPSFRAGNFGGLANLYDPATGAADGTGRTQFPGNVIPSNRIAPASSRMLSLVPLPNLNGNQNNFFVGSNYGLDRHSIDEKVTWQIDSRTSLFGKISNMAAEVKSDSTLGKGGGTGLSPGGADAGSGYSQMNVIVAGVGFTRAISSNLLLDGNFGFGRNAIDWYEQDYGTNQGLELLGIPGTNGTDIRSSGLPSFAVSGFETMGNTDPYTPEIKRDNTATYVANLSWSKSNHSLRFGVQSLNNRLKQYQPQRGFGPRGGFTFGGGITALRGGASANFVNAFGDFLLGQASSLGKSYQYVDPMTVIEWQHGLYVQDQWRISNRLTATFGLRWELHPIMTRQNGVGIERYDFATNQVRIGGVGNIPLGADSTPNYRQFVPRLGLAYRLTQKTVLRGGFGMTVDPYPFSRAMRDPYPVTVAQIINSSSSFLPAGSLNVGIPPIAPIDLSAGVIPMPVDAYTKTLAPGKFDRGYIQSYNFTIEQELPGKIALSTAYVGTRSIRQLAFVEANAGQTPGAGSAGQPLFTAFRRNAQTQLLSPYNDAIYHSLQVNLQRRLSSGLAATASYTYSKSLDYTTDSDAVPLFNVLSEVGRNRAPSNFDRRQVFQSSVSYELPFGKGQPYLSKGPLGTMFGGWRINAILSAYTGLPFTPIANAATLNAPFNTQVADQVKPDVAYTRGIGTATPWLDISAYSPVTQARFGNAGRNSLRGPGATSLNLGLGRSFRFTERIQAELRGEAFNATNTPLFANPGNNVSTGAFGRITSTAGSAADSRVIRVSARVSF